MEPKELGLKIKKFRKQANLSQEELGKKVGYCQDVISYWELGKRRIKVDDLIKLAQIFQCGLDDIVKTEISLENRKKDYQRKV